MGRHKRGNPLWGKPEMYTNKSKAEPTQWEILVLSLFGTTDTKVILAEYAQRTEKSKLLFKWAHTWANRRYIPESVLKAMGITPDVGNFGITDDQRGWYLNRAASGRNAMYGSTI